MSPLAERIALLLTPEGWEEWAGEGYWIEHKPSGIRISVCCRTCFKVIDYPCRLPWWERWRLYGMARHIVRKLVQRERQDDARRLAEKLMTAEERAIEDLLR